MPIAMKDGQIGYVHRPLHMSPQRRAAFARVARQRFDAHEARLLPGIQAAISGYLAAIRAATGLDSLTASAMERSRKGTTAGLSAPMRKLMNGDTAQFMAVVDAQSSKWDNLLDDNVMGPYDDLMGTILQAGLGDTRTADDLIAWRIQWLADRRQSLVGVPDSISSILRTGLSQIADARGTNVADAASAVQAMLNDGYPSWTNRAQLIARTETVSANNQGSLAQFGALAGVSGQTATKTWLATSDARTRDDHAEVDGTTVGLDDMFEVGGDSMNGPGDPAADAGQLCNCRCTMTYDFPDGSSQSVDAEDAEAGAEDSIAAQSSDGEPQADAGDPDQLTAASAAPQSGVAIMAVLSADDATRLMGPGVPDPDAPGFHVTLGYLAQPASDYTPEQRAALMSALTQAPTPISADIFGTATLNDDDGEREPAAVLLVQSDELATAHDAVSDACATALIDLSDTFPIWLPHVTVGYSIEEDAIPSGLVGTSLTFSSIVVSWGDDVQTVGVSDTTVDDAPEQLTSAQEEPVTAPTVDPPAPTTDGADGGDTAAASSFDLTPQGVTWQGPIAILGTPSSDGRMIQGAGLVVRPLPLPLSWQKESGLEHDDSVVVGRILAVEVRGDQLWGSGDFLDPMINFDVEQAMAQIDAGLGLVSVDMAPLEVGFASPDGTPIDPILYDGDDMDIVTDYLAAELGGATIVSFPAFADARITLDASVDPDALETIAMPIDQSAPTAFAAATPEPPTVSDDGSSITLSDGTVVEVGDKVTYPDPDGIDPTETGTITVINADDNTVSITPDVDPSGEQDPDRIVDIAALSPGAPAVPGKEDPADDSMAAALLASSEVRPYSAKFFAARTLDGPTPLTVDAETGEVFGHLATFDVCHVGKAGEGVCVTAPHSKADYGYFHLSPILTDEGPLDVGKITVGTGHASPRGGFANAVHHYDNTGTAVAVVRASEDKFGIQVSGQIIHDTSGARVEELMRSPLSGDWRTMNGNLELTAALAVNVPGFPVRRPRAGMARDRRVGQLSLVAAAMIERVQMVRLPSGAEIPAADMEALVAAATHVLERGRAVRTPASEADATALRAARLRVLRSRLSSSRVSV